MKNCLLILGLFSMSCAIAADKSSKKPSTYKVTNTHKVGNVHIIEGTITQNNKTEEAIITHHHLTNTSKGTASQPEVKGSQRKLSPDEAQKTYQQFKSKL